MPEPDPRRRKRRIVLRGDVPSPANPPSGCRFRTRCWLFEQLGRPENCIEEEPELKPLGEGQFAACHWSDRITPDSVAEAERNLPLVVADTGMEDRETEAPVAAGLDQKGPLSDEGAVPHA